MKRHLCVNFGIKPESGYLNQCVHSQVCTQRLNNQILFYILFVAFVPIVQLQGDQNTSYDPSNSPTA
nr:hypothetical protein [Mangrovibacterium lignilyticum]